MHKLLHFFSALILLSVPAIGQIDSSKLAQMQFRNVGPAGMSGRVAAIDVDPINPQIIYAGAASGGLWQSKNGGQSWACIFNNEGASSVGDVTVDPSNPSVIWIGTGEGNPRNSQSSGYGIYKSVNGGKTWQHMGLKNTRNIHRVLVHPTNSNIVYVAAIGVAWGTNPERGIFKTIDGGQTWEKILYIDEQTGAADLVMDPRNPNKLIAAMWQYQRWPWIFKSGGPKSGMYITHNGGKDWEQRTSKDGLPEGDLGRMGIAIAPSNPEVVYALIENEKKYALYASSDGGFSWKKRSENSQIGNRPFYYAEIYVSPTNANKIYSLWTLLTMSEDGGRSWKTIAPYSKIHPDHHAFWVGKNPAYLIEGNDGGLNISNDGGKTWRFVENLPLAQFYHIRVDNAIPYNIYGGMQDNGSWRGPAYVWHSGGIRNSDWRELFFGDGFDVMPNPDNNRYVFAQFQEGNVAYIDVETGNARSVKPVAHDSTTLRFNWNAAIAQDPFNTNTIYFGSQFLHKSTDLGRNWEVISPDLTTNDTAHQKQLESGGLTYDVTGAENYTTIISIAPSPLNADEIWVGTDDGNVQVTHDGGANWTNVSGKMPGLPEGAWICQIVPSEINKNEAFVVANDYRRNNWGVYVYHTKNGGKSFARITNQEAVEGYAMSIIQDVVEENLLFLGTELGLYVSFDKGRNWQKWGNDFPTVPVSDLAIQKRESDLVVGTFGRAAWVLDDISPLRALAKNKAALNEKALTVFAAPPAYNVAWRQADGTRFAADAMYEGENRTGNARISFWINPPEDDTAFANTKKVNITVYSKAGKQIKQYKRKWNDGINRIAWDLTEKGVRYPSTEELSEKQKENDASGVTVLPGSYKIKIEIAGHVDSTWVAVLPDPRVEISADALRENYEYNKNVEAQIARVSRAADQLRKAEKQLAVIEAQLTDKKGNEWKSAKDLLKQTKDSLEAVKLAIWGKQNVEGYFSQPETWQGVVGNYGYMASLNTGAISQSETRYLNIVTNKTDAVLNQVNDFITKDWTNFVGYFQQNPISLLQNLEPVKN